MNPNWMANSFTILPFHFLAFAFAFRCVSLPNCRQREERSCDGCLIRKGRITCSGPTTYVCIRCVRFFVSSLCWAVEQDETVNAIASSNFKIYFGAFCLHLFSHVFRSGIRSSRQNKNECVADQLEWKF